MKLNNNRDFGIIEYDNDVLIDSVSVLEILVLN